MSLYDLKKEYEERRQALVDQLQRNSNLDPATQHQIYGAIKEIENFLQTMEFQISNEQQRGMNMELASDRSKPMGQRTQGVLGKISSGTKRVFTEHIPNATRKVVTAPKNYFDRRKEEARLRKEVEAEFHARRKAQLENQNAEYVVLEHPHQVLSAHELPPAPEEPQMPVEETRELPLPPAHEKRAKVLKVPSKKKARPSQHAQGKKGGQHKPHNKRDKYKSDKRKNRR